MDSKEVRDSSEYQKLEEVKAIIHRNIELLTEEKNRLSDKVQELYDAYHADNPELHNDLSISVQMQRMSVRNLNNNLKAKDKPYFGKLVLTEEKDKDEGPEALYIGKKGVYECENIHNQVVIDWRAPISDLYYKEGLGTFSYESPDGTVQVEISSKRTFEIEKGQLIDFYDSETIANDELLIKYLSRNKDAVLNEIVATIQQEQNAIIRMPAWKNVVVQGVAGSGKTTVAMHRIAYLLYNYKDKLSAENFYVIASSGLFLNYITSMLPDLEVENINTGMMEDFLTEAIQEYDKKFKPSTFAFQATEIPEQLAAYFEKLEYDLFYEEEPCAFGFTLINREEIQAFLANSKDRDLKTKAEILDARIQHVIKEKQNQIMDTILNNRFDEKVIADCTAIFKLKGMILEEDLNNAYGKLGQKYGKYFRQKVAKLKYKNCIQDLCLGQVASDKGAAELERTQKNGSTGSKAKSQFQVGKPETKEDFASKINGLCLTLLCINKLYHSKSLDDIKHVVIDEAQDFDEFVYYTLKELLPNAKFTIVGDVMQSIYAGGLSTWQTVNSLLHSEFITMVKSYRNTIEISEYANQILARVTKSYQVEPVIRHGKPVVFCQKSIEALTQILNEIKPEFGLKAIICKSAEDCKALYSLLNQEGKKNKAPEVKLLETDTSLDLGTYLIPVLDTKGLEFDAVVIWDSAAFNLADPLELRLFYVSATRALHELYICS